MNKKLTLALDAALLLISLTVLALAIFWLPYAARISAELNPEVAYLKFPILMVFIVAAFHFTSAFFKHSN